MDLYLGQIFMFGGPFPPSGSLLCDGSILQVNQYQALFSLLGYAFGGNGTTTFALPDLRGRMPMGQGAGTGLTNRTIGNQVGTEGVVLDVTQIPSHTHALQVSTNQGSNAPGPAGNLLANSTQVSRFVDATPDTVTNPAWLAPLPTATGHSNMMPYATINYCIATTGVYPSRG